MQSILSRNFVRDSVSSFGFGFFLFFSSYSCLWIVVCIGVWSAILTGFLGAGSQNVFFCCSSLIVLRNSFN